MNISESSERFLKVLRFFGLSEYEARVYVSLVRDGVSGGGKLSMRCGVPRTKVYPTLKKLVERGLVLELLGEPRRYASISPANAFEEYLWRYREETSDRVVLLKECRRVVSLLEEAYEEIHSTMNLRKEEVLVIQDRSEILGKMKEILSKAKKSVTVITTENGFLLFYRTVGKLLDKIAEAGVNVHIATPINSHNASLARELNYVCKVRHVDIDSPILYLSADDQCFLMTKLDPASTSLDSEKILGVVCSSPSLCNLFSLLLPRPTKKALVGDLRVG